MQNITTNPKLYEMFGVAKYAETLMRENKQEELKKLDETLSKFILMKGIENLSDEARKQIETEDISDGMDLYKFFNQHIENFQEKLKDYGRDYKHAIIGN